MANNINVGSYGNLEEGSNTIRTSASNLQAGLENSTSLMRNIQKPKIFEGPIADYVNGVWDNINNATQNNISKFEQSANTLDTIDANYQATDKKSSDSIGDIL